MEQKEQQEQPKAKRVVEGAYDLSLGISMVVAVVIGVLVGLGLKKLFGVDWLFWVGVAWGIGGAILNVYKAYKRQVKAFEEYKDDQGSKRVNDFPDDDEDEA